MATAPLTNVALAVKLDPSLPKKLKGLYIMGGNTDCESLILTVHILCYQNRNTILELVGLFHSSELV